VIRRTAAASVFGAIKLLRCPQRVETGIAPKSLSGLRDFCENGAGGSALMHAKAVQLKWQYELPEELPSQATQTP
jgi:hypothetical protein